MTARLFAWCAIGGDDHHRCMGAYYYLGRKRQCACPCHAPKDRP